MAHRIMVLGALTEFVPLVALANEKGIETVVVDGNAGAPAKKLATKSYDCDIRDIAAVAEIAKKEEVESITTAYSDLLLECMVKIADAAGLPCHLIPCQLPYYRDKNVTNRTLEELGIPTPGSKRLEQDFTDAELSGLSFPMVIKPLDMYGSRGLIIVNSPEEIREHFEESCASSKVKSILAEEYNPDHEFNIQCWVRRGEVHVLGIADREKTTFHKGEIPLSTRNIYPSRLISHVYEPAKNALQSYIGRTKQTEGPLCMQFFWGMDRGFEVNEIAARFLGYEHELLRFSDNVSTEELLLAAATGNEAEIDKILEGCNPFGDRVSAVLYFHGKDGIISDEKEVVAVANDKDVQYGQLFYRNGDRVGDPQTEPYFARFYLIRATREEIDEKTREIFSRISAVDESGKELIYRNEIGEYKPEETI